MLVHQRPALVALAFLTQLLIVACAGGGGAAPAASKAAPAPASPAATAGAAGAPAPARPAEPAWQMHKMTVPYTPIGGPMAPLWIAVEEKLFEKHGLEVTPQFVGGSSPITQAMAAGEFDLGVGNGGTAALNKLSGGDILIVALHAPYFSIDAWSKPEIRSIPELRGKTIGVTRLGSSTHFAAIAMLASAGLQPTDVTLLQTGGLGESLAALFSLQTDAVMLAPPQNMEAQKAGFHQVAVLSQLGEYGKFPETGVLAREAVLTDPRRREIGVRFLRAFNEALVLAKSNAEVTKAAYRKYTQVEDDAVLQATYDFYSGFFPNSQRVEEQTIRNLLTFLDHPGAKDADPKLFYDNSLVDETAR